MVLSNALFRSRLALYSGLFLLAIFPGTRSLEFNSPTSASQYIEIVSGQKTTVSWNVEKGDPSSFKLKLRNRNVRGGEWTLQDNVATSLTRLDVVLPSDLPEEVHYYFEALIYDPDLEQIATTSNFAIVDANDAHLSYTPQPSPTLPPPQPTQTGQLPSATTPASTTNQPNLSDPTPATTLVVKTGYTTLFQTLLSSKPDSASPPGGSPTPFSSNENPSPPSTTPTDAASTVHKANLGAILGGVFAGIIVLISAALCLLLHRRRRRLNARSEEDHVVPFIRNRSKNSADPMQIEMDEKEQLRQLLKERETLEARRDSLQTSLTRRETRTTLSTSSTEAALRRQIEEMNHRIIQLEAMQRNSGLYTAQLMDNLPPPEYTSSRREGPVHHYT